MRMATAVAAVTRSATAVAAVTCACVVLAPELLAQFLRRPAGNSIASGRLRNEGGGTDARCNEQTDETAKPRPVS